MDHTNPAEADSTLDRVVESSLAKAVTRIVLPTLLAIIGFFVVRGLNAISTEQEKTAQWQAQSVEWQNSATITMLGMKGDMGVLAARVDYSVVERMKLNESRIEKLEQRLDRIDQQHMQGKVK